ncbi:MAG: 2Fe-2S iron-sulfur cluster-binding protein [Deltaproteobacteria bacterium]|nr:2Fe-2S iron-sulfur cluster-binding protein [Deltaproteobacteria bacterium]
MVRVVFERTAATVECQGEMALVDLCDQHPRAGIPLACRDANCGTCRLRVNEGLELCEPPSAREQALLDRIGGGDPRVRLGCQLVVREGDGVIRLWVTL